MRAVRDGGEEFRNGRAQLLRGEPAETQEQAVVRSAAEIRYRAEQGEVESGSCRDLADEVARGMPQQEMEPRGVARPAPPAVGERLERLDEPGPLGLSEIERMRRRCEEKCPSSMKWLVTSWESAGEKPSRGWVRRFASGSTRSSGTTA